MLEGLYLHIPFCARRCHYCDFNTYEGMESLAPTYVEALIRDMDISLASHAPASDSLKSIFFGGGTPSLLEASQVEAIINAARVRFKFAPDIEITLEANPGTADLEKFKAFKSAGVNRLSFGFQAKQDALLEALGRIHDAKSSGRAWDLARQAGFDNLSLDLMFGLPGQSLEAWHESLDWALKFQPEHVSFYGLTLEPGTRFHLLHERGELPLPVEDVQAEMYEQGIAKLAEAGLAQYEISNFARPGRQSVHNRLYWRNQATLGLGAGAWSFIAGERSGREKNPKKYIEMVSAGLLPIKEKEHLEGKKARSEAVYLGLRMLEGIDLQSWREQKGIDFMDEFGTAATEMARQGLLEWDDFRVRLTAKGLPLSNGVFEAFL